MDLKFHLKITGLEIQTEATFPEIPVDLEGILDLTEKSHSKALFSENAEGPIYENYPFKLCQAAYSKQRHSKS